MKPHFKFVYLTGLNNMKVPIDPDKIVYIDGAMDENQKIIIGLSQIVTDNNHGIRVKGSPQEVGHEIEKQCKESIKELSL